MPSDITFCPQNPDEQAECNIECCPCCGGLGVAAKCPGCNGTGAICTRTLREAQLAHQPQFERCDQCKGRGWFPITVALYERMGFGPPAINDFVQRRKQPAAVRRSG